ncbi:premelanosome protein b [Engraulis encrasicolus]|uniref:premelanosome protein b n=1 Tax=Engraulis encrasicolus TaxID=184585 RepID=UPI002FD751E3
MKTLAATLVLVVLATALARQDQQSDAKPRFIRYQSWNSKMYPVWKHGDSRYKSSWTGGQLKFDVGNDAPTLTGARITFTIDIQFPSNQKVLENGEVVWAKNTTVDGKECHEGQSVYSEQRSSEEEWNAVFPDGVPLGKDGDKKPPYVFVWKAWGQYWQVCDGPTSSLTIPTDGVPLGSYLMDVVIYHYRKRDKFIPIGYASTQFSITDQIPFEVSLSQVNDIEEDDQRFVQNRAVAFSVTLHDPSQYLATSDITYNWEFGDGSGTVISRENSVTHTYMRSGGYHPKVVVQAAIPDPSCSTPPNAPTPPQSPTSNAPALPPKNLTTAEPEEVASAPLHTSAPADASGGGDESEDEPPTVPAGSMNNRASSINPNMGTVTTVIPLAIIRAAAKRRMSPAEDEETGLNSYKDSATTAAPAEQPSEDEEREPEQRTVVVTKRFAPRGDCLIYRYGSFSTGIQIVEGIESVEIVQVSSVLPRSDLEPNAIDFTITCRGSRLPTEVCTVLSDANCLVPIKTMCNPMPATPDCQLVLRHFFNDSGIFCVNVSMTNDVSLAATSTRVSVNMGSKLSSSGTVAVVLCALIVAAAVGTVALTYQHMRGYRPLTELPGQEHQAKDELSAVPSLMWSLLGGYSPRDNRTLLRRVV